jgi:signal transduction histidine kinase
METDKMFARFDPRHWSLTVRLPLIMIVLVGIAVAGVFLITVRAVQTAIHEQVGSPDLQIQAMVVDDLTGTILLSSLIAIGLAAVVAVIVTRSITRPLLTLADAAEQIGEGHLGTQLPVATSGDEIGRLTNSFSQMAEQLQQSFLQLEERSQQRVRDLEVAAEISRQLTTVLEVDELLGQVVNRIQTTYGYYHVHVYLIDSNSGELIMREGTGEVGRQLKLQGHKLRPGQGIVGSVARSGEPFLAENVANVPNFVRNKLLPKTQAELAVPLHRGQNVLGVLDLQSEELGKFGEEELTLMQLIADQVAVALENARLFQQARGQAAEAERVSQRLTRENWQSLGRQTQAGGYTFTRTGIQRGPQDWLPAMEQAVRRKNLVRWVGPDNQDNGESSGGNRTSVAIPLRLRGQVIGAIGIERPAEKGWTDDELTTVRTVTDQISRALENARLSKEQENTIVQLKEVDRLKSEFLTSMSHELRTPLNSIIGFADVLLQGIDGELNELVLNDVGLIYNSGQHLLALINDILDISKIEAGMMELIREALDVEETVDDVLAASNSLIKDRPVEILVDIASDLPPVYADKLRLNQVLLNLVSNAAKFTHVGRIMIEARVDDQRPDSVRIAVSDTGIGIPPEQVSTIFDRFRQADSSTTRVYGGTGLGLAICKQLIEMHDGDLGVVSEIGVGSEFYFSLPVADYVPPDHQNDQV